MGHTEKLPAEGLEIGEVASLLGVTVAVLTAHRGKLDSLAELTQQLLEINGEEWIRQHAAVIFDQWKIMLSLGI